MLIIEHTVETTATPTAVWQVWEDVNNWNTWDHGVESSTINGPFEAGTTGKLKPKGGPSVNTTLTKVERLNMFLVESKLPLTKTIVSHYLTEDRGKTLVTHKVEMTGLLSFLFSFLIGRKMQKNLPQEMIAMVKKAESLDASS